MTLTRARRARSRSRRDRGEDRPALRALGGRLCRHLAHRRLSGESGNGYIAIRLINALNTGGLQITTQNKAKGQFAFEFTGHYSIKNPEIVPYELYIKQEIGA